MMFEYNLWPINGCLFIYANTEATPRKQEKNGDQQINPWHFTKNKQTNKQNPSNNYNFQVGNENLELLQDMT